MFLLPKNLLFLLPFLFLFFTFYWRRKQANLPPGPPSLPIIGNLHNLSGLPHLSFHRLSKKYGPLIYLKLGQVPTIVISSADMASEILKSNDHIFCSRSQQMASKLLSYGCNDIAFSPFNHHWRMVRRISNAEVFSLGRVQSFAAIRREEVDTFLSTITKACSRREVVNLSEMLLCLFNNILFREVFGLRVSADGECWSSPLHCMIREVVTVLAEVGAGDLFPSMAWIDVFSGWRRKIEGIFQKMDSLFEGMINERMLKKSDGDRCSDHHENFLDVLLHLHEAGEDDKSFTMNKVKAILMNMFTAGIDTSAATVEWGMTELMKNPATMKKAQQEVRRVIGDKGKVEESDLQHLDYLKMVIKESLRLNPPGPLLPPRECMKDTKIAGYDIPAKTRVHVNIWSIGKDPNYWGDDSEVFRPERFENNTINFKGGHFEFIPFGAGRRICPGMALAMAGVELVYASVLHGFDWALPEGMVREDIDMSQEHGLVTSKKVPLVLKAKPTLKNDL